MQRGAIKLIRIGVKQDFPDVFSRNPIPLQLTTAAAYFTLLRSVLTSKLGVLVVLDYTAVFVFFRDGVQRSVPGFLYFITCLFHFTRSSPHR